MQTLTRSAISILLVVIVGVAQPSVLGAVRTEVGVVQESGCARISDMMCSIVIMI